MKKLKKIPNFKNENEEREFWQAHDSTDYIDWSKAKAAKFPNLKPSTTTISLRLPESMYNDLKIIANKNDIPCQSFIKQTLSERLQSSDERIFNSRIESIKMIISMVEQIKEMVGHDRLSQDKLSKIRHGFILQYIQKYALNIDEAKFAKLLGLKSSELSKMEHGLRDIDKKTAKKLEDISGVDEDIFLE